jgi:GntR family transcriptional regulator
VPARWHTTRAQRYGIRVSPAASDALEIALDRDADVPVGVQLAWSLRARILAGTLAPGDRLPALHRLAAQASVNANTVRAVYQRLEHDGLVTTRHGSGTFVTGAGEGAGHALGRLAADAARAARDAGVDPRELAAALYVGGEAPAAGARPRDGDAAARRRLRAQIAALEHAISDLTARRASRAKAPADDRPPRTPRPRLLSAAELAEQRDELLRRLAEAHVAG